MTESQVSFVCNCGEEILMGVKPDEEYNVVCAKCGQEYRFFGHTVLRWKSESLRELKEKRRCSC